MALKVNTSVTLSIGYFSTPFLLTPQENPCFSWQLRGPSLSQNQFDVFILGFPDFYNPM